MDVMNSTLSKDVSLFDSLSAKESVIVVKLDWYSLMVEKASFNDALRMLGMDHCIHDFLLKPVARSIGFDENIFFSFEGITLSTKVFTKSDLPDEGWFDRKFDKFKLEISGSGLQFLRDNGFDVDVKLRSEVFLNKYLKSYHATRCDFAVDMVNYQALFLDQLIEYCNEYGKNGRVPRLGSGCGMCYQLKLGSEKTVYFGSKGSKHMLRVYDKRLQFTDSTNSYYVKSNPYNDPDSWIRLEMQLRREEAGMMLFGEQSIYHVMRNIYEKFAFAVLDPNPRYRSKYMIAPFWDELFPWDEIESISLNRNFVQFREEASFEDRVRGSIMRGALKSMLYITKYGLQSFFDLFNVYLEMMNDADSLSFARLRMALNSQLKSMNIDLSKCPPSSAGLWYDMDDSVVRFKSF